MGDKQPATIAFFDFDGTLTRRDSLRAFLRFATGGRSLFEPLMNALWQLSVVIIRGRWSVQSAKEALLAGFFAGWTQEHLESCGKRFAENLKPDFWHADTVTQLQALRDSGATIVIVSASLDAWLKPIAEQWNVYLLCTEMAYEKGRFTGRFQTPNCKYEEKVQRIRAKYDLAQYERVVAYGNSSGDYAMLRLAQEAWIRKSDGQLVAFH